MTTYSDFNSTDTIAAVATAPGTGGIAVIRISGPQAIIISDAAWKGHSLSDTPGQRARYGQYVATDGTMLDECVATVFRAPHSFTGEDTVEISIHGSRWIQREVLADLIRRGARTAGPGEFTRRAFLNGRIDLTQAEGVADLIAASSRAAHKMAVSQVRGKFAGELETLREQLIEFASLLELELDFSEEDIEFADRTRLMEIAGKTLAKIRHLAGSYSSGAAIKEGVTVAIAGVPNAGKSSLLNYLLNDDKAIVSDIPGTTRDAIEDTVELRGILFRFVDTAGLRESADKIENLGIARAKEIIKRSHAVIWLFDPDSPLMPQQTELKALRATLPPDTPLIVVSSKSDLERGIREERPDWEDTDTFRISSKTGEGIETLIDRLVKEISKDYDPEAELMVTNSRHYESLIKGGESLERAIEGIEQGLSADFVAQDVREALHHLGTITGTITTPHLLHSIFSRFCVGK